MSDENLQEQTVTESGGGAGPEIGGHEQPTRTMDETIRETYARLLSQSKPDDEGGGDGPDSPQERRQPTRGADGRFVRQGGDQQHAQEQQQNARPDDKEQQTQQQQQQTQQQQKPHDRYPQTWRRDEALTQAWSTLPEIVREEIHRREQHIHDGLRQYRDAAAFGTSIAREMLPYQNIMRERGVEPRALIRDIMSALHTMATGTDERKAQVFLKLANDYGINLDTVQSMRTRAPAPLAPELSDALQRIQRLETYITSRLQEAEQRQLADDEATVQRFLNDPKNEHARTVQQEMAALLQSGQADTLEDAYQQALWLNAKTRQILLNKQEEERRKREADEVAQAKRAGAANVQRRGTPATPPKPGTMEDTIRREYRRLMNG